MTTKFCMEWKPATKIQNLGKFRKHDLEKEFVYFLYQGMMSAWMHGAMDPENHL